MKITNRPVGSSSVTPQAPTPAPSASGSDAAAPIVVRATNYTPSPELQRLLDLVREEPETRAQRVQEVAQRLAQGNYLTALSDEKVAQAILDDRA